ncbi:MAG: YbhB/YbcL family Raf kinase inhibitor-like protein, partial [Planctomycetota bacterium]|nr:YbhB/YbcL family Raf kinase inhibitor-like protein [Planctomycetota bacterium]
MKITISSEAFDDGRPIPAKYTADGQNISPPLSWTGQPAETKELSLIVDDPDAPTKTPWVHWVMYKIPSGAAGLAGPAQRRRDVLSVGGIFRRDRPAVVERLTAD